MGKQVLPMKASPSVSTLVLTMVIEAHARYRGIQACQRSLHGIDVSLGMIAGMVQEVGQRAQNWLNQQQAPTPRALALDEP